MNLRAIAVFLVLPCAIARAAEPTPVRTTPNAFPEAVERAMMLDGRLIVPAGFGPIRFTPPLEPPITDYSYGTLSIDSAIKEMLPAPDNDKGKTARKVLPGASPQHGQSRIAIRKALHQRIAIDVVDMPLARFVDSLSAQTKIDIAVDHESLKEEGLKEDAPITFRTSGLPLESVLTLSLQPMYLTWLIDHGVLEITSEGKADTRSLVIRTYDVADLVACRNSNDELRDNYDPLIEVISTTVEPKTWNQNGGPASLVGATLGTAKVLVVCQSPESHREIAKLLKAIRKHGKKNVPGNNAQSKDKPQSGSPPSGRPG